MNVLGEKLKRKQKVIRYVIALGCAMLHLPGNAILLARAGPTALQQDTAVKIPADQLDSLVAPIALYPDNLLSQTLVASTYPLEIIQLQQWLDKYQDLASNQQKLAEAVKKQPWDSSIQAMAALPDVVKRLADDIQWTTDLGNAFLAQQSDIMRGRSGNSLLQFHDSESLFSWSLPPEVSCLSQPVTSNGSNSF
jgi:Protein of unknown function (DUF3300)